MMNKQNVPELRFPEFSGEWKEQKLEEVILSIKTGTSELGSEQNSDHPLIKMGNLKLGGFKFDKLEYLSEEQASKAFEYRVNKGDFLFNTRNTLELVGKAATWLYESSNYLFNSNIARIEFDKYYLDTKFLNYYYSTNVVWRQIKARAVGTTSVAAVYPRDLYNVKVKLPSIQEQLKISKFFIKIDRLINLEEKKLELLEEQKKGYMQKIFSQELRFKAENGNDYPEWEEERLGSIATIHRGLTYKPSDISKDGVRVLRSSNIVDNTFYLHRDDIFVNEEKVKLSFVKKNDILITAANGSPRLVGKNALINENIEKAVPGGFMYLLKSEAPKFVKVWMETREYKKMLTMVQGGNGSIGNLSRKDLEHAKITLPIKEEREKIGEFFMNFEELGSKHKDRLRYLQKRKQSFLQKMFI